MPYPQYQNADGLAYRGPDYYKQGGGNVNRLTGLKTFGAIKQYEIDVDLVKIPNGTVSYTTDLTNGGAVTGFNGGDCRIPAYGSVVRVTAVVVEAATGGTSITIGTYNQAGTAIAATGLMTATEGVIANFDTIGKRTYGAGSLVSTSAGTASVGAVDAFVGIAATGTFTAGKLRLIIEFIDPLPDAA